jgi:hypothetical protein
MPRNPSKARCTVPGCRNWSMRDHTRCRPHRNLELGPQRAGPPPGNLYALRSGAETPSSRSTPSVDEEPPKGRRPTWSASSPRRPLRMTSLALSASLFARSRTSSAIPSAPSSPYRERLQDHLIEIAARTTPQEALLGFRRVVRRRLQGKKTRSR